MSDSLVKGPHLCQPPAPPKYQAWKYASKTIWVSFLGHERLGSQMIVPHRRKHIDLRSGSKQQYYLLALFLRILLSEKGCQINCSPQCCLWQPAQPACNPNLTQNTKHKKQNKLQEVVVYSNLSTTTNRIKKSWKYLIKSYTYCWIRKDKI